MTTIIAGKYKGRKLLDYKNTIVRPTQGRVRKSVMQILEPFDGLKVLDLFAGIGTLGLEALSRGAKSVTFVEKDHSVFFALKRNLLEICTDDDYSLFHGDAIHYITNHDPQFDIIIADPPYYKFEFEDVFEKAKQMLLPNGIFCMEMKRCDLSKYTDLRVKKYGSTQVIFWRNTK
jgi:16S rRNA (guanine966-N2)-methyltransferase